jgi:hypothetical protein
MAKDAQENHAGLDVVTVSPAFTDEVGGELYRRLYVIPPNRAGDDFVGHRITLAHVQDLLLAELNRTALILALEPLFVRVQIFGGELAFAKFCQKEWPSENVDRVVAGIVRKRGAQLMSLFDIWESRVLRYAPQGTLASSVPLILVDKLITHRDASI